jgi:hypothetical protein
MLATFCLAAEGTARNKGQANLFVAPVLGKLVRKEISAVETESDTRCPVGYRTEENHWRRIAKRLGNFAMPVVKLLCYDFFIILLEYFRSVSHCKYIITQT